MVVKCCIWLFNFCVRILRFGRRVVVIPIAEQHTRRSSREIWSRSEQMAMVSVINNASCARRAIPRQTSEHPAAFRLAHWPFKKCDMTSSRVNGTSSGSIPCHKEQSIPPPSLKTPQATVEFFARFLAFVAKNHSDPSSSRPQTNLLYNALKYITESYLPSQAVHTSTSTFDLDGPKDRHLLPLQGARDVRVERGYGYSASTSLGAYAAVDAGDASVYAVLVVRAQTRSISTNSRNCATSTPHMSIPSSRPSPKNFLPPCPHILLSYHHGLDVSSWLSGSAPHPPVSYLASVAVSFPAVGLTQLTQYLVTFKVAN